MAIWRKTGVDDIQEPVALGREDMGLDVYLCASGPSLASVEDSSLHVNGALVAAINNAYPHIKPDAWFGLDDFHCFPNTLWTQPFMKFVRRPFSDRTYHGIDIGYQHNTYYADVKDYPGEKKQYKKLWDDLVFYDDYTEEHEKIFYKRDLDHSFLHRDSCRFATSVLLFMGAKKFFLIGMDLDNSKGNYYDKALPVRSGTEYLNRGTFRQVIDFYRWASEVGVKYGVEFISCTENSPLNAFLKYVPLQTALSSTVKKRSYPKYNIIDGRSRTKEIKEARRKPMISNEEDKYFNNHGEMVSEKHLVVENVRLDVDFGDPSLTLVDRMILFECDSVVLRSGSPWEEFWQTLIDEGIPWSEDLPRHYARMAATMIREGLCILKSTAPDPPSGWDKDTFLQGPLLLGYDVWDRPPSNPNWSRPFRWNQIQKARVRNFKQTLKETKGGAKLDSRSCGGCKG